MDGWMDGWVNGRSPAHASCEIDGSAERGDEGGWRQGKEIERGFLSFFHSSFIVSSIDAVICLLFAFACLLRSRVTERGGWVLMTPEDAPLDPCVRPRGVVSRVFVLRCERGPCAFRLWVSSSSSPSPSLLRLVCVVLRFICMYVCMYVCIIYGGLLCFVFFHLVSFILIFLFRASSFLWVCVFFPPIHTFIQFFSSFWLLSLLGRACGEGSATHGLCGTAPSFSSSAVELFSLRCISLNSGRLVRRASFPFLQAVEILFFFFFFFFFLFFFPPSSSIKLYNTRM